MAISFQTFFLKKCLCHHGWGNFQTYGVMIIEKSSKNFKVNILMLASLAKFSSPLKAEQLLEGIKLAKNKTEIKSKWES